MGNSFTLKKVEFLGFSPSAQILKIPHFQGERIPKNAAEINQISAQNQSKSIKFQHNINQNRSNFSIK